MESLPTLKEGNARIADLARLLTEATLGMDRKSWLESQKARLDAMAPVDRSYQILADRMMNTTRDEFADVQRGFATELIAATRSIGWSAWQDNGVAATNPSGTSFIHVESVLKWLKESTRPNKSLLVDALEQASKKLPSPFVAPQNQSIPTTKSKPRKKGKHDLLAYYIKRAQDGCSDPFSCAEVWIKLKSMIDPKGKVLIGSTEDGIQWVDSSEKVRYHTKNALKGRLNRAREAHEAALKLDQAR